MIDRLWSKFKELDFTGSVATYHGQILISGERTQEESLIYKTIFDLDPDYTQACIIRNFRTAKFKTRIQNLQEIDVAGKSESQISTLLDDALLNGLGHQKAFLIKTSGALVKFGYENDELI